MYYHDVLKVEDTIRERLIEACMSRKDPSATIAMLEMYQAAVSNVSTVTAREFNGIVQSMKRAGIVGTAKGGDIIFLTRGAYTVYVQPRLNRIAQSQNIEVR
jgi:hypothetical protein